MTTAIDKQHRGRDIFTGIQRLAEQEVKCRKLRRYPKAIIEFFYANAFLQITAATEGKSDDGNGKAFYGGQS